MLPPSADGTISHGPSALGSKKMESNIQLIQSVFRTSQRMRKAASGGEQSSITYIYIHSLSRSLSEYKQYRSIPRREATHLYGHSVLPPFFLKDFTNDILKIFQDQTEMAEIGS